MTHNIPHILTKHHFILLHILKYTKLHIKNFNYSFNDNYKFTNDICKLKDLYCDLTTSVYFSNLTKI